MDLWIQSKNKNPLLYSSCSCCPMKINRIFKLNLTPKAIEADVSCRPSEVVLFEYRIGWGRDHIIEVLLTHSSRLGKWHLLKELDKGVFLCQPARIYFSEQQLAFSKVLAFHAKTNFGKKSLDGWRKWQMWQKIVFFRGINEPRLRKERLSDFSFISLSIRLDTHSTWPRDVVNTSTIIQYYN